MYTNTPVIFKNLSVWGKGEGERRGREGFAVYSQQAGKSWLSVQSLGWMHRFLLSFRFLSLSVITYVFNKAEKRGTWEQRDKQGAVHDSGSFRRCPVGNVSSEQASWQPESPFTELTLAILQRCRRTEWRQGVQGKALKSECMACAGVVGRE